MTLSERRALAVKNYILKNFPNIQAARFQTIGRGSRQPGRAERHRGRPPAQPAHRHQGRPRDAVAGNPAAGSRAAAMPSETTCREAFFALRTPIPRRTASTLGLVAPALVLGAWCAAHLRRARAARLPALARPRSSAGRCSSSSSTTCGAPSSSRRGGSSSRSSSPSAVALPLGVLMGAFEPVNRLLRADRGAAALHADLGLHPAADPLVRHLREAEDRVPLPRRLRLPAAGGRDRDPRRARGAGADRAHARRLAAGR